MTDVRSQRRSLVAAVAVLLAIALLVAADLLSDRDTGAGVVHLALEGAVILLALGAAATLVAQLQALRRERRALRGALRASRQEAERWRAEARDLLEGLGGAIERQFERWDLSPAEAEVALLLLKGLPHRQIAELRGVSERTVRQQAHTVYVKANLEGRADLAAFFLEGLWLPGASGSAVPDQGA